MTEEFETVVIIFLYISETPAKIRKHRVDSLKKKPRFSIIRKQSSFVAGDNFWLWILEREGHKSRDRERKRCFESYSPIPTLAFINIIAAEDDDYPEVEGEYLLGEETKRETDMVTDTTNDVEHGGNNNKLAVDVPETAHQIGTGICFFLKPFLVKDCSFPLHFPFSISISDSGFSLSLFLFHVVFYLIF